MLGGERIGLRYGLRVSAAGKVVSHDLGGNGEWRVASGEWLEESGGPEVAGLELARGKRRVARGVEATLLFLDEGGGVIGNFLQCGVLGGKPCDRAVEVEGNRKLPVLQVVPFATIAFLELTCSRLVVARGCRERIVGDAGLEHAEVQDSHQGIAAADAVIEKREGFAFAVRFEPEGDAAEFDRQRVFVHAVDAVCHHIADRFAGAFGGGFVLSGANAREFFAEPPCCCEQEVARAAGGVEDADAQERMLGAGSCE